MKLNHTEKTAANEYQIEFSIEAEKVKDAVSSVYRKTAKKYNVPGFRKGKAPRHLIEKVYGEDVFIYDAVNEVFPDEYEAALKEAGLEPISRPDATLVSATAADGAVLKVTFTVKPEIKLGKYFGLAGTKTIARADEDEVDAEIERMRQRNARLITREGAAEKDDIADLDYEGSVDGVPFEGGKADGHKLTLGSGQFIEGFEEQVIGHKAGEEFDINVTFPPEYHAKELAGKPAVFKVKINEIQQKELPDLDDEFAKDVSEYDTLDELNNSIRENLQKELDEKADQDLENQLVDQIIETIEGEIPQVMYETRLDETLRDFSMRLQQQGLNLETYVQYAGSDMKTFREGFRANAEKQVKIRLALETIAKLEGIEVNEDDVAAEVARIAERYQMEAEQVKKLMPEDEIKKDLAVNKAIDLVKEKAVVTEEEPKKDDGKATAKAEKKAAKKPAAKKVAKVEAEEAKTGE